MPRVAKAKRLRRRARIARRWERGAAWESARYAELAARMVAYMRDNGLAGIVSYDADGVTVSDGAREP